MATNRGYIVPPVDIYQTDEAVVLQADVPGLGRDDLNVQISDGELTIDGAIPDLDLDGRRSLHRERRPGRYYLAFTLSDSVDPDQTQARVRDGVLTLTLGKREQAKPREIQIETVE